ncbi:MAG: hypothetical protein EBT09_14925, partial [Actinobacteria bacterium]|nr:hypothetical protein [Actinomycetota bacterium]
MEVAQILAEIEPVAGRLLERHMGVAKEWFPHEMVPYDRGKNFESGAQWSPGDADFGDAGIEIDEPVRD